jgi:hypothetical protein
MIRLTTAPCLTVFRHFRKHEKPSCQTSKTLSGQHDHCNERLIYGIECNRWRKDTQLHHSSLPPLRHCGRSGQWNSDATHSIEKLSAQLNLTPRQHAPIMEARPRPAGRAFFLEIGLDKSC